MFINFSNHPSSKWDGKQRETAEELGEIIDVPFPEVSPFASEEDIVNLAADCLSRIKELASTGDTVMVQGEFSLTYAVVNALKKAGFRPVSACSERNVEEYVDEDGMTMRKSVFSFVRFREYI